MPLRIVAAHTHARRVAYLLKLDNTLLEELANPGGGVSGLAVLQGDGRLLPDYPGAPRADLSLPSSATLASFWPHGACNIRHAIPQRCCSTEVTGYYKGTEM